MEVKRNEDLVWICDRICCPSQCYFDFTDSAGQNWVLYLRWRSHPWSSELFRVKDNSTDEWDWDNKEKIPLSKVYENEEDCEDVILESYKWLREVRFPELGLPEHPLIETHYFTGINLEDIKN